MNNEINTFTTVRELLDAGAIIHKGSAVYAYQYYGFPAARLMRLYGFYYGVNTGDGLVDCGNGVYCKDPEEAYIENGLSNYYFPTV